MKRLQEHFVTLENPRTERTKRKRAGYLTEYLLVVVGGANAELSGSRALRAW